MATGTVKATYINPPDIVNATRTALTSETALNVTSTGKWYCVVAINGNTSGSNSAYLANQTLSTYYAATQGGTGTFLRSTTGWVYFPNGTKFAARAFFTYADASGLYAADPL